MTRRQSIRLVWEAKALLLTLVLAVWAACVTRQFLTGANISSIFLSMSVEGAIAVGMAYVLIAGEIDLSVGATMALSAVLAILTQQYGVIAGVSAAVGGGLLVGLVNGILVAKCKLDSIPTTLGMMVLLQGLVFVLTGSESIRGDNPAFLSLAHTQVLGIPFPVLLFLAFCAVFEFILRGTHFGHNMYAVGGNAKASRLHGISVERVKLQVFCISGGLSGLAGALLAAKLNIATGQVGFYTLLNVITAVLLGGVSLAGGRGSVMHALQGFLLIAVLNNVLVLTRVPSFVQQVILGLILIGIVILDSVQQRRLRFHAARKY